MNKSTLRIFIIGLCIIYTSYLYPDAEVDSLLNDSAKALSEKRNNEGLILLYKATEIADEKKDVDACLKVGSAYIDLPGELGTKELAVGILKRGKEFAKERGKWHLLNNFAIALQRLGERDIVIDIYDELFLKAGELKDKDTFIALKNKYTQLGDPERAELCNKMIEALTIPPPPNWQPLGETVRGPKKSPPAAVQATQRQMADQEVEKTIEYFIEKKKLEKIKK